MRDNLTENFTASELMCPCCEEVHMDPVFMIELQKIRSLLGVPMVTTSGWRCEKHNAEVSSNSKGDHVKGLAVDISIKGRYFRANLLKAALESGYFKDIAIAKTFIHLGKGKNYQGVGVYGSK